MDRLTNRMDDGTVYIVSETGTEGVGHYTTQRRMHEVVSRLAHYEDLEEQGRLVVLPCAVGDSYFRVERFCDEHGELEEAERHFGSDCEYCCKPCNAELRVVEYSFANIRHIIDTERAIGKTVFLTRAEAEAALAAASGKEE